MSIVGLDAPDFRTISDFRKRHLKALASLFTQVLKLCAQVGLAHPIRCAPTARIASGGRFHPESCRLIW